MHHFFLFQIWLLLLLAGSSYAQLTGDFDLDTLKDKAEETGLKSKNFDDVVVL